MLRAVCTRAQVQRLKESRLAIKGDGDQENQRIMFELKKRLIFEFYRIKLEIQRIKLEIQRIKLVIQRLKFEIQCWNFKE